MRKKINPEAKRWQRISIVAIMDILCIAAAFFSALLVRYEFSFSALPAQYMSFFSTTIVPWIVLSLMSFSLFGLYKSIWSFVSIDEMFRIILAYACLGIACVILSMVAPIKMPASYYFLGMLFSFGCTVASVEN